VSKKGTKLANGLLQCMMSLHDVLFQLGGVDGEALQAQIAKVTTMQR
jgi:spore maturation protein SpmB